MNTNRTDTLKQFMSDHNLTIARVSKILNRSPRTVKIWRCKDNRRQIPEHTLELLRMKVEAPEQ